MTDSDTTTTSPLTLQDQHPLEDAEMSTGVDRSSPPIHSLYLQLQASSVRNNFTTMSQSKTHITQNTHETNKKQNPSHLLTIRIRKRKQRTQNKELIFHCCMSIKSASTSQCSIGEIYKGKEKVRSGCVGGNSHSHTPAEKLASATCHSLPSIACSWQ